LLTTFNLNKSEQWDSVVRTFINYDVYWLSGYVKAFCIHGDGEALLLYFSNEDTKGINVVMKRDIAHSKFFEGKIDEGKYFDFSSPYGCGGWLVEGTRKKELFSTYEYWCQKNNIISEFIRFHPVLRNHLHSSDYYEIKPLGRTITLDLSSPEIIWANFTSKNRNMIRKAQKNGIRIYNGRFPEIFETFREVYNGTMQKDKAGDYYYFNKAFYESICNDLSENAQVFYAIHDEKIIAASIMLSANGKMNYHLSGSLQEYSSFAPTNLLLYKAALWAQANGCKTLYLGGGLGGHEDSLFKFKKSFFRNDDLSHFFIGEKIINVEKYDELVRMRGYLFDGGYFPKYRE